MFFRRVFVHITQNNWTAVGIELLVVVVGVFVGLQASNWNDGRVERAQERGYLIRLHEDFSESARGLKSDIGFLEEQLSYQASVLTALDACHVDEESEERVSFGLVSLGFFNPPRFFRRTVDELAASGRLNIVQSEEIRAKLARIVALVEFREKVMPTLYRRLEHHLFFVQGQLRFDLSGPFTESILAVPVRFDIQELCKQPRNAAAISAISLISNDRLNASSQLHALYIDFMPLIENELRARWDYDIGSENIGKSQ